MSERGRMFIGCALAAMGVCLCTAPALLSRKENSTFFRSAGHTGRILEEIPTERSGPVRVNIADADELQELPGIGETYSAMILSERELNGPFYYPEDLTAVRGIGPATVRKLRGMIDFTLDESGD